MKNNNKKTVNLISSRLKGQTSLYLKMPMYFALAALPMVIWEYTRDIKGGFILSIALSIYLILSIVFYNVAKGKYKQELIDFATDYTQVQKKLIKGLDIPYGLLDKDGKFLWGNYAKETFSTV